jgi:transposase
MAKACWLTSEVRSVISRNFGIAYSARQVARILSGLGMHYAKPYATDYRRPDNAKELLEQAIKEVAEKIPSDTVIGFFDEASPQTTDNKQRFWSFGKPKKSRNTTKFRANTFGFYPVNGNAAVEIMDGSRLCNVHDFLRAIKDRNPGKHIVTFLDNFSSHISRHTKRFAESIGITLVFIPKYSPDLNPIEFIWKAVRRRISQIDFVRSDWSFKEAVRTAFCRFAKEKSFMAGWLENFQHCFPKQLCH